MNETNKQKGAVSLFVVIFAALLITVVTVSFIRLMILNQQQAVANNLSQSAYDSAQAGVEDGKRAILSIMKDCSNSGPTCAQDKINDYSLTCNAAVQTLSDYSSTANSDKEIPVQTGSISLNQAYTCVTVTLLTDDVVGSLDKDESTLIPLVGVTDFNTVKIEWFNNSDLKSGNNSTDINFPSTSFTDTPLLSEAGWTDTPVSTPARPNIPSIMRTQLIQFQKTGLDFNLDDFDYSSSSGKASNNTLFLYPSNIAAAAGTGSFALNGRPNTPGAPSPEHCETSVAAGTYACSAVLALPKPVDANHAAYLNLRSLYKSSHYKVTLINSPLPCVNGVGLGCVQFDKVQPIIDSTGRADDLFRRVQSRVSLTNVNFPYPNGEIQVTGNLCKDFIVTNKAEQYDGINGSTCIP